MKTRFLIVILCCFPLVMTSCKVKDFFSKKIGIAKDASLSKRAQSGEVREQSKTAQPKQEIKTMSDQVQFLQENQKREGVQVTDSGLQYEVIKEGTGASPNRASTVEVHYKGTLIDGTEFDSSYKRNQTATFPLNRVIAGWTEGIPLMKEGGVSKFFIPAELGYGSQAVGGVIPANATLIFEVELIKVVE